MPSIIYDVAIIGTGPAGGMAAIELAKAGAKIVLLEAESLPRDKACGGALTKAPTEQLLDWNFDKLIAGRANKVINMLNYERRIEKSRSSPILFVNRRTFDLALIERALALSPSTVDIRDEYRVKMAEEFADYVTLTGPQNDTIRAQYVIGCGGVKDPCIKSLGLARHARFAPAIDVEIMVDTAVWEAEKNQATFNFACISGGYGWTFPKDNGRLSCGVVSWDRSANMPKAMKGYLSRSFNSSEIISQKQLGHPIPPYHGRQRLRSPRILLAGDAANLVDPYLGEGIRYALHSGKLAAQSCLFTLEKGQKNLGSYEENIHMAMGDKLKTLAKFVAPTLVQSPEYFYKSFIEKESKQSSEYS